MAIVADLGPIVQMSQLYGLFMIPIERVFSLVYVAPVATVDIDSCHIRRCFINIYSYVYDLFCVPLALPDLKRFSLLVSLLTLYLSFENSSNWTIGPNCAEFFNDNNKTNCPNRFRQLERANNWFFLPQLPAYPIWTIGNWNLPTVATGLFVS